MGLLQRVVIPLSLTESDEKVLRYASMVARLSVSREFHFVHVLDRQKLRADDRETVVAIDRIAWLVEASQARGITHWYAVMEPQLLRLLSRLGIHFDRIGDLVDYHGWRQPCVIEIDRMLDCVQSERPDVWSIIAQRALDVDHA